MVSLILGACRDVLIYLAGPLFSEAERRFNLELTHRLEAMGFDVFLPQRDGVEHDGPPYDTMTPEVRRHVPPRRRRVRRAVPDEGACV